MNRVKIIKRANLQLPIGGREKEPKKIEPPVVKREEAKTVAKWIEEWREQKPQDARRAFAALFGGAPVNG